VWRPRDEEVRRKTASTPALPNYDAPQQGYPAQLFEPVDPSAYNVTAALAMPDAGAGMLFMGRGPSSQTINIDTGLEYGGNASAPEPIELLLLSLGACTGMDIVSILRKKRQVLTHYWINVYADQAEEHPRLYTRIFVEHMIAGENIDAKAVARSIEAVPIEHAFRILDPTSASLEGFGGAGMVN
jgi:putative redox protein